MLTVFPDESVQSYIIRVLMCLGELTPRALGGIVSPSGSVNTSPLVLLEHAAYFTWTGGCRQSKAVAYCAREALSGNHQAYRGKTFLVDAHRYYGLPEGMQLVGKTQMRFCPSCFKEQIYSSGTVWFKENWLYEERCLEHDMLMFEVRRYRCDCGPGVSLSFIKLLQSVMSGKCVKCNGDIWNRSHPKYVKSHAYREYPHNYRFHDIL